MLFGIFGIVIIFAEMYFTRDNVIYYHPDKSSYDYR